MHVYHELSQSHKSHEVKKSQKLTVKCRMMNTFRRISIVPVVVLIVVLIIVLVIRVLGTPSAGSIHRKLEAVELHELLHSGDGEATGERVGYQRIRSLASGTEFVDQNFEAGHLRFSDLFSK